MAEPTRVVRPSSLVTWLDCPRRWAARHLWAEVVSAGYGLQAARPQHVGACVGSGVHAGAGWTMEEKRRSGELGNSTEAEQRALEELSSRAAQDILWDGTTGNLNTAEKQVVRMTKVFRHDVAPKVAPLVVEQRLDGDLGDGWVLSGQADILGGDPTEAVEDLKTGTVQRANSVQYGAYALLFEMVGYSPTKIRERFIKRVRIDKPQPPTVTTEMDMRLAQADALEVIDDIKRSTETFHRRLKEGGRPPPTAFRGNPASSLCGEKWCAAWGTKFCHAHKR